MDSNQESARRSRRRQLSLLTDLEIKVAQLKGERCSLLKRLDDVRQKVDEAAVEYSVLKAEVETLKKKVNIAEETVEGITGMKPLVEAMSEISTMGVGQFGGSGCHTDSVDAAMPVQDAAFGNVLPNSAEKDGPNA